MNSTAGSTRPRGRSRRTRQRPCRCTRRQRHPSAPPGVDPKVWRETQSKVYSENEAPASRDVTTNLRKEVQGLPSYKNFAQAAPIYRGMTEAAGRDTKAADLNLVYGLGKIMDPTSVVREGEIVMANDTQGWAGQAERHHQGDRGPGAPDAGRPRSKS